MPNWKKVVVSGSDASLNSLNVTAGVTGSFTGSLQGTATTASYVVTAQTASYVVTAQTASYVLNAVSSSFASTASYVNSLNQNVVITGSLTVSSSNATQFRIGSTLAFISSSGVVDFGDSSQLYNTWLQYSLGTLKLNRNTTSNFYWNGSELILTGVNGDGNASLQFTAIAARSQILIRGSNNKRLSFSSDGANTAMQLASNGNLYIGTDDAAGVTATARLEIKGSGATSATNALLIKNSSGTALLTVNDAGNITGSFTGSFLGTASYATQALTASNANTASYVATAQTASYVLQAVSSSFASTASYVVTAQTASYVLNAVSASFASTASYVNPLNQNVLITGSSSNSLRVKGSGATSATNTFYLENSSNINTFAVADNGNVTINTGSLTINQATGAGTGIILKAPTDYYSPKLEFNAIGGTSHIIQAYGGPLFLNGGNYNVCFGVYNAAGTVSNVNIYTYPYGGSQPAYPNNYSMLIKNPDTTGVNLMVRAASGQAGTGSITEWQNSGGTEVVAKITASGSAYFKSDITASSFSGSHIGPLTGTASYATTALTASNANTASFVATAQTASYVLQAVSSSFASTASYVNTLNQTVIITGSAAVGTSSLGPNENTLTLGARDAGSEGGQLGLNAPGGTYTSASMIDNYANFFRILRGTNAGSDALVAQWNLHNKQMQLPAYTSPTSFTATTLVGLLGFDSSGNLLTTTTSSGGGGGVTINNNTDNYIITATGTANTLNGESNLQFNGSSLTVTGQITSSGAIISNANGAMYFRGGDDAEFWDVNVANTVGIYGQQTQGVGAVKLGSGGPTLHGSGSRLGIGTTGPVATVDINGNLYVASGITGSLQGTATTASYVVTAQTASYVTTAQTASYVLNAVSASFASTASFVTTAQTASYVLQAVSSSFASTASFVNPLVQGVTITGSLMVSGGITTLDSLYLRRNPAYGGTTQVWYMNSVDNLQTDKRVTFNQPSYWSSGQGIQVINANVDFNGSTISNLYTATIVANASLKLVPDLNYALPENSQSLYIRPTSTLGSTKSLLKINDSTETITYFRVGANGSTTITGSLGIAGTTRLSGSYNTSISGSILTVIGSGSSSPIFTVQGSQGELFSITDSLSGSLFSVNDISGLPILEVFSDNTTLIGDFQAPALHTTKKISGSSGINLIYSLNTGSYDGVFMDYTAKSGSNARAGNFAAIWSGSSVNYMDNSTTDFGNTSGLVFGASISGSNMIVTGSASTSGWTIKAIIRSI